MVQSFPSLEATSHSTRVTSDASSGLGYVTAGRSLQCLIFSERRQICVSFSNCYLFLALLFFAESLPELSRKGYIMLTYFKTDYRPIGLNRILLAVLRQRKVLICRYEELLFSYFRSAMFLRLKYFSR